MHPSTLVRADLEEGQGVAVSFGRFEAGTTWPCKTQSANAQAAWGACRLRQREDPVLAPVAAAA
eukprot:1814961-Pleurochrysis_carterae.AAC.2